MFSLELVPQLLRSRPSVEIESAAPAGEKQKKNGLPFFMFVPCVSI
jgi:hypothetical protein